MKTSRKECASAELLEWLGEKLVLAEISVKAREQMVAAWRRGTDKSWKAAGCSLSRAQRLVQAGMHARIRKKCLRDVEMFKAAIVALSQS